MTKQEVRDLVFDAVKNQPNLGVSIEELENGLYKNIYEDFGLDSLDCVEVIMGIEQEIKKRTGKEFIIDNDFAGTPNLSLAMIINYVYDRVCDEV